MDHIIRHSIGMKEEKREDSGFFLVFSERKERLWADRGSRSEGLKQKEHQQ